MDRGMEGRIEGGREREGRREGKGWRGKEG